MLSLTSLVQDLAIKSHILAIQKRWNKNLMTFQLIYKTNVSPQAQNPNVIYVCITILNIILCTG